LVLGAIAAWWLARSLAAPLARLTAASERIADGELNTPVDAPLHRNAQNEIGILAHAFETMRVRVAAMTGSLRDERDVLDAVLESTGDGIMMLDTRGSPVVSNAVWRTLLGTPDLLASGCSLELSKSKAGLPLADADPQRVEQIMANLVDNAIKYSPHGGTVRIRIGSVDASTLSVSVSDQGMGIKSEDTEHLFERFYRVESTSRSIKGVGLGLFICRSLVESHGGRIWVESQPGRGSTFVFTLPALHHGSDEAAPREDDAAVTVARG
jgi:signal transduction histidine kinase